MSYLMFLSVTPAADHPVDPALLEYLGSVDSEDKDWHDYLAHTDIDQVARHARRPSAAAPNGPTEPVSNRPPVSAAPPSKSPAADATTAPPVPVNPP
jgi:hypothetical protein